MRTTRAYIASAGTASVMLAASLAMLALVSTYVAFGSWPGASSGRSVDQVVLDAVAKPAAPRNVAVHPNAVAVANRAAARRQVALARTGKTSHTRTHGGTRGAGGGTTPAARAPSAGSGAGTTARTGKGGATPVASVPPAVQQPVKNVVNKVNDTTSKVGGTVQQTAGDVQNQVNDVVNQVIGGPQTPAPPSTDPVGGAVQTVTNTAGSLPGH
jgi:hypothetical protein